MFALKSFGLSQSGMSTMPMLKIERMFYCIVVITFTTCCLTIPTYIFIRENFPSPRYNLCMTRYFLFLKDLWLLGGPCDLVVIVCFNYFSNVSRNPFFIPSELVMRRVLALNRNSRESDENQMFLHLQNSFQNVPVISSLYMNKVNASKESCSIYPNIIDINFSNKYWQIFKNGSTTLHLYGAYFGKLIEIKKKYLCT